jgi:hypothetical protein
VRCDDKWAPNVSIQFSDWHAQMWTAGSHMTCPAFVVDALQGSPSTPGVQGAAVSVH